MQSAPLRWQDSLSGSARRSAWLRAAADLPGKSRPVPVAPSPSPLCAWACRSASCRDRSLLYYDCCCGKPKPDRDEVLVIEEFVWIGEGNHVWGAPSHAAVVRHAHRQGARGAVCSEVAGQTGVIQSSVRRKRQHWVTARPEACEDALAARRSGSARQHDISEGLSSIRADVDLIAVDAVLVGRCHHIIGIGGIDDDVGLILWVIAGGAVGKGEGCVADDCIGGLRADEGCIDRCRAAKWSEAATGDIYLTVCIWASGHCRFKIGRRAEAIVRSRQRIGS